MASVHSNATSAGNLGRVAPLFNGTGARALKVAAVCYRRKSSEIEFLLVNTDSGRWTFPKGSIDDGMSDYGAAEQEAFEEAGATGRIERTHFAFYLHARRNRNYLVKAFLLEVWGTDRPVERYRTPVWCTAEQAKKRLARYREGNYVHELCRVVDSAVERITRKP
jgi:8-oxo-dGTP pyrophosphatase MutT (NUDIX family)